MFEDWTINELFLLRLLTDRKDATVDIVQDIEDLLTFPERIETSYPCEWRSHIRRYIKVSAIPENHLPLSASKLIEKKGYPFCISASWDDIYAQYLKLNEVIEYAQTVSSSETVSTFPTPLKTWLHKVIR